MASHPVTGHVRKRQYQPSIASYLTRGESAPERLRSPLSPQLPPDTQSSLMNVGMRVRKAVPEGYKTHKTLGMDGFPFPSTAPPAAPSTSRPAYNTASSRELTPFCGLHKVGGWAQQENVPPSSAPAAVHGYDGSGIGAAPSLSFSQDTLASTQASSYSTGLSGSRPDTSRKRSYNDEVEDDMDAYFEAVAAADATMSTRQIAMPRATLKKAATVGSATDVTDEDFEEASFLAPMDVDGP